MGVSSLPAESTRSAQDLLVVSSTCIFFVPRYIMWFCECDGCKRLFAELMLLIPFVVNLLVAIVTLTILCMWRKAEDEPAEVPQVKQWYVRDRLPKVLS